MSAFEAAGWIALAATILPKVWACRPGGDRFANRRRGLTHGRGRSAAVTRSTDSGMSHFFSTYEFLTCQLGQKVLVTYIS